LDIQILKEKLKELKSADKDYKVFGSGKHRYLSYPVSVEEIENFETKFNLSIPQNFRKFLIEIGCGAGPCYGIFSLKEVIDELYIIKDIKAEANIDIKLDKPFPFNNSTVEDLQCKHESDDKFHSVENTYPANGSFSIIHRGCSFYSAIITKGELLGHVWNIDYFVGYEGNWYPPTFHSIVTVSRKSLCQEKSILWLPKLDKDEIVITSKPFENWYEDWLDNGILALQQLKKLNSRWFFNKWN
jgi:hypothetical protein